MKGDFAMSDKILEVNDLEYSFDTYAGEVHAIRAYPST